MKIYLVGGAVRDHLLGRISSDNDYLVVGATPQQMLDQGFQQVGASFPVFLHPETRDEYALARVERKTGEGYHGFKADFGPEVTVEEDLKRRDLTINAMAIDILDNGVLIDPYGGAGDLAAKTIRHVSEAFAEDPLRVLRAARFASKLNFTIAPETMNLMKVLVDAGELEHLSKIRIWKEIELGLRTEKPWLMINALVECGAVSRLAPYHGALDQRTLEAIKDFSSSCDHRELLLGTTLLFGFMPNWEMPDAEWGIPVKYLECAKLAFETVTDLIKYDTLADTDRLGTLLRLGANKHGLLQNERSYCAYTIALRYNSPLMTKVLADSAKLLSLDYGAIAKAGDSATIKQRIRATQLEIFK